MVIVSTLVAVAGLVWARHAQRDGPRRTFERRTRGLFSLDDMRARPKIPDADNVAAGFASINEALDAHDRNNPPPRLVQRAWFMWEGSTKAERAVARRYLDSVASILGKLDEVLRRPGYRSQINWSTGEIYDIPGSRHIGDLLLARALAAETDAQLVEASSLLFRLAARAKLPFVWGASARMVIGTQAVEALRMGTIRDAAFVRRRIEPFLENAGYALGLATPLREDRAKFVSLVPAILTGELPQPDDFRGREHLMYREALSTLAMYDRLIARDPVLPLGAAAAVKIAIDLNARDPREIVPFERSLFTEAREWAAAGFREYGWVVTHFRLAASALELMEMRQKRGGWPERYPDGPHIPDPNTGAPFLYERTAKRVRLFSEAQPDRFAWVWPNEH